MLFILLSKVQLIIYKVLGTTFVVVVFEISAVVLYCI
jgi:hypothetical protein